MEANLPVVGDGVTHYKYQGLTMDPADIWDPTETKGMTPPKIDNAIKGTRVQDLCDLVGGMEPGTEVTFVATDNWATTLPYDCIYPDPHVYSHLGDTVIAWYADGQYVPAYGDGPRVFFTPEDHVTGQWDMHEALADKYWHYNYQGGVNYPSVAGLSAKYIKTIKIYDSPVTGWSFVLDGEDIGGLKKNISRNFFESALSCQFGANHEAQYTDGAGRTWSGMPLWFLAGYVDDDDMHSKDAFNQTLAAAGYDVVVAAGDGVFTVIPSELIARNNNYIVANALNGTRIAEDDSSWPLRLVGQNVTGGMTVKAIASISLVSRQTGGEPEIRIVPAQSALPINSTGQYQVILTSAPGGLAGYDLVVSLSNPSIAEITGVQYPGWAVLNDTTPLPPTDSLRLSGVDLGKSVQAGAVNVLLATITVRADSMGTSAIAISNVNMDADGGSIITPDISSGQVVVHAPLVADFTANVTSGKASLARPLFVQFTDLSTGDPPVSSWSWDFDNNGVVDSTLQDPVASFNKPGNYTVNLTVQNTYSSDTEVKVDYIRVTSLVKPFPGQTSEPTDPDGDGLYEDINGNGRLDYDDVVIYYDNMQWIRDQPDVGIEPYDYNGNGRIDYDDVVLLYEEVLDSRP
jgi:PKD repeat protein